MVRSMCEYMPAPVSATRPQLQYSAGLISQQLNALSSVLLRTSDTGQVNYSTYFQTASNATGNGVEVYSLNDALSATKPIYIKIEYQAGGQNLFLTVGTATNGASSLTGVVYAQAAVLALASTATLPRYCVASSDGSYLMLMFNLQNGGSASFDSTAGFVVERTRDPDGTPNGNGYMVWRWSSTADTAAAGAPTFAGVTSRIYDTSVSSQPVSTFDVNGYVPNLVNSVSGVASYSGYAGFPPVATAGLYGYPVYGYSGVMPQGASKALMLAYTADVPRLQPVTMTHYGAASQWMSLGGTQLSVSYSTAIGTANSKSTVSPLVRWE